MASNTYKLINFKQQLTRRFSGVLAFGFGILVLSAGVIFNEGSGDDGARGRMRKVYEYSLLYEQCSYLEKKCSRKSILM